MNQSVNNDDEDEADDDDGWYLGVDEIGDHSPPVGAAAGVPGDSLGEEAQLVVSPRNGGLGLLLLRGGGLGLLLFLLLLLLLGGDVVGLEETHFGVEGGLRVLVGLDGLDEGLETLDGQVAAHELHIAGGRLEVLGAPAKLPQLGPRVAKSVRLPLPLLRFLFFVLFFVLV